MTDARYAVERATESQEQLRLSLFGDEVWKDALDKNVEVSRRRRPSPHGLMFWVLAVLQAQRTAEPLVYPLHEACVGIPDLELRSVSAFRMSMHGETAFTVKNPGEIGEFRARPRTFQMRDLCSSRAPSELT